MWWHPCQIPCSPRQTCHYKGSINAFLLIRFLAHAFRSKPREERILLSAFHMFSNKRHTPLSDFIPFCLYNIYMLQLRHLQSLEWALKLHLHVAKKMEKTHKKRQRNKKIIRCGWSSEQEGGVGEFQPKISIKTRIKTEILKTSLTLTGEELITSASFSTVLIVVSRSTEVEWTWPSSRLYNEKRSKKDTVLQPLHIYIYHIYIICNPITKP